METALFIKKYFSLYIWKVILIHENEKKHFVSCEEDDA